MPEALDYQWSESRGLSQGAKGAGGRGRLVAISQSAIGFHRVGHLGILAQTCWRHAVGVWRVSKKKAGSHQLTDEDTR